MTAKFILSKQIAKEQVRILEDQGLKASYSYKTNHEVGDILQEECPNTEFSIHAKEEIKMIKDKSRITFFTQAESTEELMELLWSGIRSYVIDNEIDLARILEAVKKTDLKINISLRMKFSEHRIGTGKYFVYGMPSSKINKIITEIKDNPHLIKIGIHIHRKSQNTSEWEIVEELKDSFTDETLSAISFLNIGGGLPSKYKSYTAEVLPYIFDKLEKVKDWLRTHNIQTLIEPGRFIAAPSVKLEAEIIQIQEKNIIINTTIYNCCLDTHLTGTKMLIENELPDSSNEGQFYLVKGNSPTRDDIFRYKVKLDNPEVGDTITFLNAGAYNYTTDFFGYTKLETEIID